MIGAALVAVVCLLPEVACGGTPARGAEPAKTVAEAPTSTPAPAPAPAPKPNVPYDHAVTDTSRLLAGMTPDDGARYGNLLTRPSWTAHQGEFDASWKKASTERWPVMRAWRDKEFKAVADGCTTLFYPFGGPDFLNAYLIYPSCTQYLLFGLEPVGSVPDLARMAPERADAVLAQMRESLSDLFLRDYFITETMMKELRTPAVDGTLPLMLAMLARMDARIVSVEAGGLMPQEAPKAEAPAMPGTAPVKPGKAPRVTITFVAAGASQTQTLVYHQVDMMDPGFAARTSFIASLKTLAPFTTFLKSASYLMHDDRFGTIRSMVLNDSSSILEDDTGVPYRFFDKTAWALTLYGKYTKPIEDFQYGFQKDLDAAFAQPGAARDLPFTFGYHWRVGSSSVILAIRQPATR
jgi:hypothetical protein